MIVLKNDFYKKLGDLLKDFPQLTKRSPLISEHYRGQDFEKTPKIHVLDNNKTIQ
jgi:hypothetical protein